MITFWKFHWNSLSGSQDVAYTQTNTQKTVLPDFHLIVEANNKNGIFSLLRVCLNPTWVKVPLVFLWWHQRCQNRDHNDGQQPRDCRGHSSRKTSGYVSADTLMTTGIPVKGRGKKDNFRAPSHSLNCTKPPADYTAFCFNAPTHAHIQLQPEAALYHHQ